MESFKSAKHTLQVPEHTLIIQFLISQACTATSQAFLAL